MCNLLFINVPNVSQIRSFGVIPFKTTRWRQTGAVAHSEAVRTQNGIMFNDWFMYETTTTTKE